MVAERQGEPEPERLSAMAAHVNDRACRAIVAVVATTYGVSLEDLLGRAREPLLAEARRVACWVLHRRGVGHNPTARALCMDHSSVRYHLSVVGAAPLLPRATRTPCQRRGQATPEERVMLADCEAQVQRAGLMTPQVLFPWPRREPATAAEVRADRLVDLVSDACGVPVQTMHQPWRHQCGDWDMREAQRVAAVLLLRAQVPANVAAPALGRDRSTLVKKWVELGLYAHSRSARAGAQPLTATEQDLLDYCLRRARQKGLLSPEAAQRVGQAGMPQGRRA